MEWYQIARAYELFPFPETFKPFNYLTVDNQLFPICFNYK